MNAYCCFVGSPEYGCLLVYAETRNKARAKSTKSAWDWDYVDVGCRRAHPKYDGLFDKPCIIESNDELPKWIEPFYTEAENPFDWD